MVLLRHTEQVNLSPTILELSICSILATLAVMGVERFVLMSMLL